MYQCPSCGAETRFGSKFCVKCGSHLLSNVSSSLNSNTDKMPGISYRTTRRPNYPAAHLILRANNGNVIAKYALNKSEITIGREPNCDIALSQDKPASRHHATVRYENGRYVLYDERSLNGTYVNQQQLRQMTPYALQDGDCIGISDHELIFHAYALPPANRKDSPSPPPPLTSSEATSRTRPIGYAAVIKNDSAVPSSEGRIVTTLEPAQQTSSGMNKQAEVTSRMTFPSMVRDPAPDATNQRIPSFRKDDAHYSDISFPICTVVGRTEALRVAVTRNSLRSHATSQSFQRATDKDQSVEVDVHLVLSPLDFDLDGPNIATILVSADGDSTPALFKLTPRTEGRKTLAVEFFQYARFLEKRELETTVVSQKAQLPTVAATQTIQEAKAAQLPLALTARNRFLPDDLNYFYRGSLRDKLRLIIILLFAPWRS